MPLNDMTGKPLKHYGQDEVTKERYIVIALQNETDPDTCSVIPYDKLDSDMRSELVSIVNSDECQRVPEIWQILNTKFFYSYPKNTILQVLRSLKQIKVVDQNRVKIEITPDQTMTPKEIVEAIKVYKASKSDKKFSMTEEDVKKLIPADLNREEIDGVKKEIDDVKTQMTALQESMAELISALKSSMKQGEE